MKILFVLVPLAIGCSAGSQTISGRVEQTSFGSPVDRVVVTRRGHVVAEAPIGLEGEFTVLVPKGSRYKLEFTGVDSVGLISPRKTGTIEVAFAVRRAGSPFDLGMVRAVGAPESQTYDTDDVECEDGVDPNGAVCVDDDQDEEAGSCDDGDSDSGDSDDDSEGGDDGDDGETDDNALPGSAAVAEHNLPSQLGCGGDHENEGEEEGEH